MLRRRSIPSIETRVSAPSRSPGRCAHDQLQLAQAKARFSELVRKAMLGEEVIIARDNKPVLKLVRLEAPRGARAPGSAEGQVLHIAPDFDETPPGFEDYVR